MKPPTTAATATGGPGERLSKRVAQMLGCSRSQAEQYIVGGWVRVAGKVVESPQHRVAQEAITVDPEASVLDAGEVTLVLHKPANTPLRAADQLLKPGSHSAQDATGQRPLLRHFKQLQTSVPLEDAASGLLVFTQDWRVQRKLIEDMTTMEHELMVEVRGAVAPEALVPIERALRDPRYNLPPAKVSISSSTEERSILRLAVKGAHPGLAAYICDVAGLHINALRRIRLGRVSLGPVAPGQWRFLADWERF